jgi:hypothetical protein
MNRNVGEEKKLRVKEEKIMIRRVEKKKSKKEDNTRRV